MSELKGKAYLKSKLNKKKTWAKTRYDYYELKNLKNDPSPVIPIDLQVKYGSKLGWCAKAVDSLANRLIFDGFDNDQFNIWEIFQLNNKDIFFDSAIRSSLISACCFVSLVICLKDGITFNEQICNRINSACCILAINDLQSWVAILIS